MTTTEQLHQQLDRAARIQAANKQLQIDLDREKDKQLATAEKLLTNAKVGDAKQNLLAQKTLEQLCK